MGFQVSGRVPAAGAAGSGAAAGGSARAPQVRGAGAAGSSGRCGRGGCACGNGLADGDLSIALLDGDLGHRALVQGLDEGADLINVHFKFLLVGFGIKDAVRCCGGGVCSSRGGGAVQGLGDVAQSAGGTLLQKGASLVGEERVGEHVFLGLGQIANLGLRLRRRFADGRS